MEEKILEELRVMNKTLLIIAANAYIPAMIDTTFEESMNPSLLFKKALSEVKEMVYSLHNLSSTDNKGSSTVILDPPKSMSV